MPQAEGPTPGPYAAAAHPSWCPSRSIEDTSEIPLVNSPAEGILRDDRLADHHGQSIYGTGSPGTPASPARAPAGMFPGGPLGRVPGLEGTVVTEAAHRPSSSDVSGAQARFHPGRASPRGDQGLHPTWGVPFSPTVARRRQSPSTRRVCWPALRRVEEAVRVALPTGSNLLLAEVASPRQSRAALHRVTRSLPSELRTGFARQIAARA
jgi:hypothetical protein